MLPKMMKKIFVIIFITSYPMMSKAIEPLTKYSFENVLENDEANHFILEGCISLYSAVTKLIINRYPELGEQFHEMVNTIYPYGIISLSKIKNISHSEAEYIFFNNVKELTDKYIDEMNNNGKKNGSYFKGSFLGEDLLFCHEVTKHLQLVVLESLGE